MQHSTPDDIAKNAAKNTLNIIGAGHVGQTLGHLWAHSGLLKITHILNRSLPSAAHAATFIGQGKAVMHWDELIPADYYLLGCPDQAIADCCQRLAASGLLRAGDVVFHCSGALGSELLQPAREQGALIASVHPVKSFADPARAIQTFANTYCGVEGDAAALDLLRPLLAGLGGVSFVIDATHKTLYHAASVVACNYLVALQEVSVQLFAEAGVERALAMKILQPIVTETVGNIFTLGTERALTGPIARGDYPVVARQLAALQDWQPERAELYRLLGREALALAGERIKSAEDRERLGDLLVATLSQ